MNLGIGDFAVGKFHVGNLLLMVPQDVAKWIAIGGIVALLMFDSLDKKFYMRPLGGLWTMYNFVTGFLSNFLSYLRLFALGLAGGLLGAAVNEIAFMFVKNAETGEVNYASIGMVLTVLLLIGGHALNMALAALGAFVHPLRLTFVEFYGQAGFEGGGKPFVPFQKIEN
jgi:V/A-type H+-transporting ATPase subunit I